MRRASAFIEAIVDYTFAPKILPGLRILFGSRARLSREEKSKRTGTGLLFQIAGLGQARAVLTGEGPAHFQGLIEDIVDGPLHPRPLGRVAFIG